MFYSKAGGGHLATAEAIAEQIMEMDKKIQVVLYDGLERTNFGLKVNPSKGYLVISNYLLPLFNLFYFLSNNFIGVKILRQTIRLSWGRSFKRIIETENPHLIATTHHFITPSTISKELTQPFVTVVTDLGKPHRIWFDHKSNTVITPTLEMAEFAQKSLNLKTDQLIPLGYPLKKGFNVKPKAVLNNTLLILGGGSGSGNLKKQAKTVCKHFPDKKIVAVCGYNQKLLKDLKKLNLSNLELHGFTDQMAELIASSDMVITKAGPAAIMEAASMQKPLIISGWVGLQEKDNVDFVLKNKLGVYCPNINKLPKCIEDMYSHYNKYSQSGKNIQSNTQNIAKYIIDLMAKTV